MHKFQIMLNEPSEKLHHYKSEDLVAFLVWLKDAKRGGYVLHDEHIEKVQEILESREGTCGIYNMLEGIRDGLEEISDSLRTIEQRQ